MEGDEKKQGEGGRLKASGSGNDELCTEVAAYLFSWEVRRSYSVRFFFSHLFVIEGKGEKRMGQGVEFAVEMKIKDSNEKVIGHIKFNGEDISI